MFEAFAGIGAQYQALKNIQNEKMWKINQLGIIEWFLPAIIAYEAIHHNPTKISKQTFSDNVIVSFDSKKPANNNSFKRKATNSYIGFWLNQSKQISNNLFDISKLKYQQIPNDIDIFTYSFPCQDISNQGKQKGFKKNEKTRSGLLWEIDRLLTGMNKDKNKTMPKYLLMENVKSIVSKKFLSTFNMWIDKLSKLGYDSKIYLLNAADFGSCQNRERVFLLSVLKTHKKKVNFQFQEFKNVSNKKPLKQILDKKNQFNKKFNKFTIIEAKKNKNNIKRYVLKNYTNFQSENGIYDIHYSGPTLTASGALSRIKLYFDKNQIREMLPVECFRYMGFKDKDYYAVKNTNLVSESKMIYLCGNSICIEILESIFRSLKF